MKTNTGNTLVVVTILIAIVIVGIWMFGGKGPNLNSSTSTIATSTLTAASKPVAHINGKDINLEVVDTPDSRELGLSNRKSLAENTAMLFVFDKPDFYEFWMKDMLFSLDMIWLDPNFKVVHIEKNVAPETYPDETFKTESEALYVIEANAGFADQNNLKVGDVVQMSLNK